MARDAVTIQAEIDVLQEAASSGVKRVRYGAHEIEYRDASDIETKLAELRYELSGVTSSSGPPPRPRVFRMRSAGRGL